MLKNNIEKNIYILKSMPKNEMTSPDENEKKKLVFLSNLTTDEFYLLYNAFDLGKSYYEGKDFLENDIRAFDGEEKLIRASLKNIKNRFTKEIGINELTGKLDRVVIESLNGYIEKFM